MSLVFSNTTTKGGIVQRVLRKVKANLSSYPIEDITSNVNTALDEAVTIALKTCGVGQFDDANHANYPIITTNLVAGQRDVTYTYDQTGNLILDIYKAMVMNESGIYEQIYQVDMQSESNTQGLWDGQNQQGAVFRYDKTANGIIFDNIPSYSKTAGIKLFINREGSYFVTSDTSKLPGIDGRLHEYLVVSAAYEYACTEGLKCEASLLRQKEQWAKKIEEVYGAKNRDSKSKITARPVYHR